MADYRIALRTQADAGGKAHGPSGDDLDDIVVNDVAMFRMEQMGKNVWWAACYLEGITDPLVFDIRHSPKHGITVTATERPHPDEVAYEGEPLP